MFCFFFILRWKKKTSEMLLQRKQFICRRYWWCSIWWRRFSWDVFCKSISSRSWCMKFIVNEARLCTFVLRHFPSTLVLISCFNIHQGWWYNWYNDTYCCTRCEIRYRQEILNIVMSKISCSWPSKMHCMIMTQ